MWHVSEYWPTMYYSKFNATFTVISIYYDIQPRKSDLFQNFSEAPVPTLLE